MSSDEESFERDADDADDQDAPTDSDVTAHARYGRPTDDEDPDEWPQIGEWLDATAGHGPQSSAEDWVRANHGPVSHDGRALTNTTFYPDDVETRGPGQSHRDHDETRTWDDLAGWQDGMYSDVSRGGQNWEADKQRWLETFAGHLECTDYQRERAEWILEHLNMEPFMGARLPVEAVILGVLSLTIDAEAREFSKRAVERELFQDLMDDLDLDRGDIVQVRRQVHEHEDDLLDPDE